MEKPRNVNTADSTETSLKTRVRSYKANGAFSIRNGKIIAVTPIRFSSLGMLAGCLWSPSTDCSAGRGNGLTSLHSRGVPEEEGHLVLKE